jgi:serine/threonine protein kinase
MGLISHPALGWSLSKCVVIYTDIGNRTPLEEVYCHYAHNGLLLVFENREKMVLVMEYAAGGELYDFLSERKVLAEEEARRIFRQIATAVYYCHKVSVFLF